MATGERYELGDGVVVSKATAEDFDELNATMRSADMEECRAFGMDGESMDDWIVAYAVHDGNDLLGIAGWAMFSDSTHLSKSRLLLWMTTNKVWSRKIKYVKYSPIVMRGLVRRLPPWVDLLCSLPMATYSASIKWQKHILGFRELDGVEIINGIPHKRLFVKRKDVLE